MTERQIFTQAVEITEPARREEFLSQACGTDHALRARVDELLAAHLAANSQFLETPVVDQLQESTDPGTEKTVALPPKKGGEEDEEELPGQPDLNFLQPSTKPGSIGTLGHYEILSILGHGAFGIVFKAFDEKLHRHVAIKMMSAQIAATSPARKRFLREARAAAAIRHDNVTQVYSVEEEPVPYLVMEFIDGQTLQSKQRKQGPLEIPELLHIGRQIAAGLAAAHEKSLIHRDVKPGNILLEQGVEQKVKITDFGLARAADDASLTRSGMISGTPLYMAPEQALGGTLDGRSDLFSLGSVLYELATGRPPFRAPTTVAVLRRVVDDTPRPMREIIPELPEWFVTIVNRLLEKNPDQRFQSAKEVADLLAKCQAELQLSGQVTCVPGAGSVSTRSTPKEPAEVTQRPMSLEEMKLTAQIAKFEKMTPDELRRARMRKRIIAAVASVCLMFPILYGRHLSRMVNSWFWPAIPTLPAAELNAGLRFDGKDDFIQVPVQWDTPVFTIEAFVTSEEGVPSGTLLHLSNEKRAGIESIELFDEQNQAGQPQSFAGVVGGKSQGCLAAPLQRGVRQHRVLTFDGDHLHYYVNGLWQAKRHVLPDDQLIWKLRQLTIGCKQDRTNFFAGVIDQLRISKVVRYKNNFAPITSVTSDDSTLALYDFDEGTGDMLRDSSGNGADGKILGATWVHPAKGLQFDGVDDYIDFENLGWSSNQYTFETWITPLAEHGTLFQIAVPEGNVHAYLYEGGSGSGLNRDKSYTNVNGPRAGMKRQHLATVFDGKNLSYFIDGKLAGSKTNVSDLTTPWTFQRLRIGGKLDPNSSKPEFFHGRMEQFRVSKSALYVLPFTPEETLIPTADTLALYNFDENQGAVLKDATGHGYDGKIVGAMWVKQSNMAGSGARTFHSGEWIDAVSLIDPGSDKFDLRGMTGRNDWKREGNHLVVGPDKLASKLVLPLDSTWSAFECELEFIRRSGAGGLNLNLPTRKGECSVVIDHASGNGGVFLGARDKGVVLSEGKKIEGGKLTTLKVTVRRVQNQDQITVSLNGKPTGQWTGNRNDIGKESTERFPVSRRISLWIHEGNNEFEFQRIRVRPLDGETITTTRPQTGWHGWPEDAPQPAIAPFTAEQAKQHQTAWASYLKVPAEFTDKHGMKFVLIPPGEFQMGFSQSELDTLTRELKQAGANEFDLFSASTSGPQHLVRITQPLYMSAHEVTIAQYRSFLEETKYLPTADQLGGKMKWTNFVPKENPDSYPVDGVSWTDADSFCVLRSQKDGVTYRLPSEAEWEFACRAGTTTLWSFGDNPGQLGEYAATTSAGVTQLQPVGSRRPNAFGLFDMYCNAEEWCRDWHVRDYYAKSNLDDPVYLETPSDANSGRVTRGGSLSSAVWMTRSSLRRWDYPSTPVSPKGFRVVITGDLKKSVTAISPPDDRDVAVWLLTQKGRITIDPSIGHDVTTVQDLPASPFVVTAFEVSVNADAFSDADLSRIGQLANVKWIMIHAEGDCTKVTEAGIEAFSQSPAGRSIRSLNLPMIENLTDESIPDFNCMVELRELVLPGSRFTDEGVQQLRLPHLTGLTASCPGITHESVKLLLENHPELNTLLFTGTRLSGPGLQFLKTRPIKTLWLMRQAFSDEDLNALADVTTLEFLNLNDTTGFTSTGLQTLSTLSNLQGLHLLGAGMAVNDAGLESISAIRNLNDLQIARCEVTDAGLAHLAKLVSLKTLGLGATPITDAGLDLLGQINSLERLQIDNCVNVTEEGVRRLRAALPKCEILSDFAVPSSGSVSMAPRQEAR